VAAAGDGGGAAPHEEGAAGSPSWAGLLRRIDAVGLLPADGIAMLSAVDIFKPKSESAADTPIFLGMEVPRIITAVIGADPDPFLEITAEFAAESEAQHWQTEWPKLQRKLRVHPYLVLTGFSGLAARATLTREGSVVRLRETATSEETLRLLELATHALGG
jgi:hypothetical protein